MKELLKKDVKINSNNEKILRLSIIDLIFRVEFSFEDINC